LKSVDDFPGDYLAISTGAAIAHGGSSALLKNKHEVTIELAAHTKGLRLDFSANSLKISLADSGGRCTSSTAGEKAGS
jgi:predicted secreted protein